MNVDRVKSFVAHNEGLGFHVGNFGTYKDLCLEFGDNNKLHVHSGTNVLLWNDEPLTFVDTAGGGGGGGAIYNVLWDDSLKKFTLIYMNGNTEEVQLPDTVHINLVEDIVYDESTEEFVIVKQDGDRSLRVHVGHLIDRYEGESSASIDVEVNLTTKTIKAEVRDFGLNPSHLN